MEWKFGEHWFAYFMFLLLFSVVGAFLLFLLDFLGLRGKTAYQVFFLLMFIIFLPIAKFWHSKFLSKRKNH